MKQNRSGFNLSFMIALSLCLMGVLGFAQNLPVGTTPAQVQTWLNSYIAAASITQTNYAVLQTNFANQSNALAKAQSDAQWETNTINGLSTQNKALSNSVTQYANLYTNALSQGGNSSNVAMYASLYTNAAASRDLYSNNYYNISSSIYTAFTNLP